MSELLAALQNFGKFFRTNQTEFVRANHEFSLAANGLQLLLLTTAFKKLKGLSC